MGEEVARVGTGDEGTADDERVRPGVDGRKSESPSLRYSKSGSKLDDDGPAAREEGVGVDLVVVGNMEPIYCVRNLAKLFVDAFQRSVLISRLMFSACSSSTSSAPLSGSVSPSASSSSTTFGGGGGLRLVPGEGVFFAGTAKIGRGSGGGDNQT